APSVATQTHPSPSTASESNSAPPPGSPSSRAPLGPTGSEPLTSPGPVTSQAHRRPVWVSATYSSRPSGESPMPLGASSGNTASRASLPSARHQWTPVRSDVRSSRTPWSVNQRPPSASNTRSFGARSRTPPLSVARVVTSPLARSTRWIEPPSQPGGGGDPGKSSPNLSCQSKQPPLLHR